MLSWQSPGELGVIQQCGQGITVDGKCPAKCRQVGQAADLLHTLTHHFHPVAPVHTYHIPATEDDAQAFSLADHLNASHWGVVCSTGTPTTYRQELRLGRLHMLTSSIPVHIHGTHKSMHCRCIWQEWLHVICILRGHKPVTCQINPNTLLAQVA
jgi:hypothetical protein